MISHVLHFVTPPIPYFVDCGRATYPVGESHISRSNIGAFDLIVVVEGNLSIGENDREWTLTAGDALTLRPDADHYGAASCPVHTEIFWIHFQTYDSWRECANMDECLDSETHLLQKHTKSMLKVYGMTPMEFFAANPMVHCPHFRRNRFSSCIAFSSCFSRREGISPSLFRKKFAYSRS
ncbi:AraC family ligand binding domain-containing protein [Paenibacillus sp. RC343]|uniref:AraC family ligand binding domain-containing protein n=1 Tax=Paenibacillus sp. RC343 TaxID=3045841 RepID=UPI0024BBAEC1|nr:AraC family ligand binding domain-containing protein [Paenibacillus sp. RC343]